MSISLDTGSTQEIYTLATEFVGGLLLGATMRIVTRHEGPQPAQRSIYFLIFCVLPCFIMTDWKDRGSWFTGYVIGDWLGDVMLNRGVINERMLNYFAHQ